MDLKKVRNKKITATRKIVYASYHQELYKKFCACLIGQHDILYHRIREKSLLPVDRDAVLYIIEMFRFTERSEALICHVKKTVSCPGFVHIRRAGGEDKKRGGFAGSKVWC